MTEFEVWQEGQVGVGETRSCHGGHSIGTDEKWIRVRCKNAIPEEVKRHLDGNYYHEFGYSMRCLENLARSQMLQSQNEEAKAVWEDFHMWTVLERDRRYPPNK